MAGLLDFFNTSTDEDLYGGLLSPQQRSGLAGRSLAAMAEKFGQLAMPQRAPIPLGAILGQGFGAYGAGNDEAVKTLFEGLLRQQQVTDLKSKAKARDLFTEILSRARAGGGDASTPAAVGTGGPLAVPAAPGGGAVAAPAGGAARGLPGLLLPEIKSTDLSDAGDGGTSKFPDARASIDYPAADSGLAAGGVLRRPQTAATPALSANLAPYQTGRLLAPQPAELPQLANYAVGNAVAGGASPITGVAPEMSNRVEAMLAGMPPDILQKFNVLSGYRSPERQAEVNPGVTNSRHTAGTAVDTTTDPAVLDWVRQNGPQYGVGYTLANLPGEANHLEMLGAGGGRAPIQTAALQTGGPLSGSAWELANNNFGGLRRPGVVAGPSQGGFQSFGSPEEGISAISRQLDRYASGATTGKPLSTIREIVSTWAPPSENDTPTLIRRASQVVGVDPDTPLDVSNPAVKAKLIEATIRNEQGGKLPVPADLINQVAAAPAGTVTGGADTVVRTGGGPALPMMRTQYAPAPGGLLAAPAAPGGPGLLTPQGKIPGFNLTPAEAAQADALAEIAGLGNPFKSILESYYKSPEYLREAAGAGEAGKLPYVGPAAAATRGAQQPYILQEELYKNQLKMLGEGRVFDEKTGQFISAPGYAKTVLDQEIAKAEGAKSQDTTTKIVRGTDGRDYTVTIPVVEYLKELRENLGKNQQVGTPQATGEAVRPGQISPQPVGTPEGQTYDEYAKDQQMRNLPVLSRYDWARTKTQPDPVNAARIAFDVKTAEPIMQQAIAGQQTRPLLDEVVRLAYQTPEGIAGESGATMGKVLAGFGFAPTDRMSNAELLGAIQQRLIGPIREPGTSSDRDVTRYLAASPGLMSTGDGRVKLAEMTKALIDRNSEIAKVYRDNLGAPDLSQKLMAIHNKPLFSDEQRAAIDETIRTRGGTVPGGVTPGQQVPAATAPPSPAAPPGARQVGTFQGKPVFEMPDGSRKVQQ